jgi:hypothetical protein
MAGVIVAGWDVEEFDEGRQLLQSICLAEFQMVPASFWKCNAICALRGGVTLVSKPTHLCFLPLPIVIVAENVTPSLLFLLFFLKKKKKKRSWSIFRWLLGLVFFWGGVYVCHTLQGSARHK